MSLIIYFAYKIWTKNRKNGLIESIKTVWLSNLILLNYSSYKSNYIHFKLMLLKLFAIKNLA